MGCSYQTPNDTIFDSINFNMKRFPIDLSDKEIGDFENVLKILEEIRFNFSKNFGNVLIYSGCIVLRKPELCSAIYGLFYQISRDVSIKIFDCVEIKETHPFIIFKNIDQKFKLVHETGKYIVEYIEFCEKILCLINKVNSKILEMGERVETKLNHCSQITKTLDYQKRIYKKFHKEFKSIIQNYLKISSEILVKANNSKRDLRDIIEKIGKTEEKNYFLKKAQVINDHGKSLDNIDLFLRFTNSRDIYDEMYKWRGLFAKKIMKNKLNLSEENMTNEFFRTKSKLMLKTEVQELFEIFNSGVVNLGKELEVVEKIKEENDRDNLEEIVLKEKESNCVKNKEKEKLDLYISRKEQKILENTL